MAKRMIRLQPVKGKFLQTKVNNHDVNIWLVDPKTNQQGTDVPYDDAIAILAFKHPVATPALIKGKDDKYVKQLTNEDLQAIQNLKENPGVSSVESSGDSTLAELVKTQGKLLETQTELMKTMKSEIDSLKKNQKKGK